MNITMSKNIEKELDSFLATKTCTDIDRTKFVIKDFKDYTNKLTTCLIFNCNCHSYEDPTQIECEYTGVVIHLPAFWLEVPKELAFTYILGLIQDVYNSVYQQWIIDGAIGGNGSSGSNNNTGNGCCCNNWTPVN